jgi:hypothetical protein
MFWLSALYSGHVTYVHDPSHNWLLKRKPCGCRLAFFWQNSRLVRVVPKVAAKRRSTLHAGARAA